MRVVALKAWSNGSFSMEEKQIADLPDALAETLIEGGIVAPTALPAITDADDGKVLTANSGVWGAQEPIGKKFIVTLTPTSPDYSGTMDKTAAEIDAAYEAGQQIVFRIYDTATSYYDIVATASSFAEGDAIKRFRGFGIFAGYLLEIKTPDGGESTYYSTLVYTLTPAT